jgi:hypothetical protein
MVELTETYYKSIFNSGRFLRHYNDLLGILGKHTKAETYLLDLYLRRYR